MEGDKKMFSFDDRLKINVYFFNLVLFKFDFKIRCKFELEEVFLKPHCSELILFLQTYDPCFYYLDIYPSMPEHCLMFRSAYLIQYSSSTVMCI